MAFASQRCAPSMCMSPSKNRATTFGDVPSPPCGGDASPEHRTDAQGAASQKLASLHGAFAFGDELSDGKQRAVAAGHDDAAGVGALLGSNDSAGRRGQRRHQEFFGQGHIGFGNNEPLSHAVGSYKKGCRPRPGLERPAHPLDAHGGARPVDEPIGLRKPWRTRGFCVVLRDAHFKRRVPGSDRGLEPIDGVEHGRGANVGEAGLELGGCLPWPIGVSRAVMTWPASRLGVIRITLTPVMASPSRIAHCTGAAPRCLGRSEPWRLMPPSGGIASTSRDRICP